MIKKILSKAYGEVVKQVNKKYDKDNAELVTCRIPVLSVGNLSMGGTGKTPFVVMLGNMLIKNGAKPGIVGKGYKRKSSGEVIVCDGNDVLADADEAGDEMILLAESLRVPVITHEEKNLGALSIQEKFDINCIIIDDGFQHRKLHRELDIVILDRETIEKPYLVPEGKLRESIEGLERADVIVLAGDIQLTEEFKQHIRNEAIITRVIPKQGKPYDLRRDRKSTLNKMDKLIAFAGIAKPDRYFDMLRNRGLTLAKLIEFDDHHYYTEKDIVKLVDECKDLEITKIATTEKDAAKLHKFKSIFEENNITCFVFPIYLEMTDNAELFKKTIRAIVK